MSEFNYHNMYEEWKIRDTEEYFDEWIEDWKNYPLLTYKTMSTDEKIDFLSGVQTDIIPIFDEDGDDTMNTMSDLLEIQNELRGHPELFTMENLKHLLSIVDDDCYELSWQKILAEIIVGVIIYNGEKGMAYYLQNLEALPEQGYDFGCRHVVSYLLKEKQGNILLRKVLTEQSKEIKENLLCIMDNECFKEELQILSELLK